MAGCWNPTTANWYERAISWSGYPLNVIGAQISNLIRAGNRVIDAGSGIGAVSLAVARSCADVIKVTAVDSRQEALGHEVECEAIVHDLSQPVSGIDDAWGFFRSIMRAPADVEQEARSLLKRYLKCRDGITYLPIIRKSCLIRFAPKSAVNKE